MKKFSPAEMKEVSFPTPHTLHPLSSQEIIFIYSSPLPHFPTSPLPHTPLWKGIIFWRIKRKNRE
jgi:hypothetical protein